MITLPKNFFKAAPADALRHSTPEGACWVNGDIWLLAGSPFSPRPSRHCLLASCYDDDHPQAPTYEVVDALLGILEPLVPPKEQECFRMRAIIVRAAARQFCAC